MMVESLVSHQYEQCNDISMRATKSRHCEGDDDSEEGNQGGQQCRLRVDGLWLTYKIERLGMRGWKMKQLRFDTGVFAWSGGAK